MKVNDSLPIMIAMSISLCIGCALEAQCSFITVKGDRFIDQEGREIILHGCNVGISWHGPEEFAKMRQWGFNCIRLNLNWDRIEPQPGVFNEEYLAKIDERIRWAKENGIYVILDMHQDLFSAKFGGDGAPSWAVLDDGKQHISKGAVWSMAYLTSPAVHAAFDNFWANKPTPDGMGLQDHFARLWQYVARRFANEPAIIGYDLFNEPFPGSSIKQSISLKLQTVLDILVNPQSDIAKSPEAMQEFAILDDLIKYADDIELYRVFADSGSSISMEFERTTLAQFYNKVAESIREVDKNHIIFLETHGLCNSGTPSGLIPITDAKGDRDPLQAFAPHAYDIMTDTPNVANANPKRIELIFTRHSETASRLGMPVVLGEWGAYYGQPNTLPAAKEVVRHIEERLFSDTYWSYGSDNEISSAEYFPTLSKPYPSAISGNLQEYRSDLSNKSFTCLWDEDPNITAPSRIYLPAIWFPNGYKVTLEPFDKGWSFEKIKDESADGYLVIPSSGKSIKRSLRVEALIFIKADP